MKREEKRKKIDELRDSFDKMVGAIFADFKGINTNTLNTLRTELKENQGELKIVKNTLVKQALKGEKLEDIQHLLDGQTLIAFSYKDIATSAKIALRFSKENETFKLKGAVFEDQIFDLEGIKRLSKFLSLEELKAKLLSTLNSVPSSFIQLISAPLYQFQALIKARKQKLEKNGG
jgi:large subunit ribosomal protein L10